jgi:predicted site-specific integrase-resolvase
MVRDTDALLTTGVVHMVHDETGELVSSSAVHRWRRTGLLKAERTVDGVYVYRARDVRNFLDRRRERDQMRRRVPDHDAPPEAA